MLDYLVVAISSLINVRETKGAIKTGQSRKAGNIVHTTHKTKTNKTICGWHHHTKDEDKQNKTKIQMRTTGYDKHGLVTAFQSISFL